MELPDPLAFLPRQRAGVSGRVEDGNARLSYQEALGDRAGAGSVAVEGCSLGQCGPVLQLVLPYTMPGLGPKLRSNGSSFRLCPQMNPAIFPLLGSGEMPLQREERLGSRGHALPSYQPHSMVLA